MSLLLRSAVRVWTKRPAGPLLIALGILVASLLTMSTDLALQGAELAQEAQDTAELGEEMARVLTPGGYTLEQERLQGVQASLAEALDVQDLQARTPLFLERQALVSSGGSTSAGWTVLGLPRASLEALGLGVPGQGQVLLDPGEGEAPGQAISVRVPKAPDETVAVREEFQGQLARTIMVGGEYVHSEDDEYIFSTEVPDGAGNLVLTLAAADEMTDFDLEAESPSGEVFLDDSGTQAQPDLPLINVTGPEPGNWTIRVHAKAADGVGFRLQTTQLFDAQDLQALGRLLGGQGWRAIGAQLGLTDQALLEVQAQRADLSVLGPGTGGLVVLPLDRLQAAIGLEGKAEGVLVLAGPGQSVLEGLPGDQARALEQVVAGHRQAAEDRFDPLQGLSLQPTADRARQERTERLESTEDLLLVVLPAGAFAGILLATWAAGLHTRRLQEEVQVLAGLGQARATSWTLVALHLVPPFLVGLLAALALSPVLGLAIAQGIGLSATAAIVPSLGALLVPLLATLPIAGVAWLTLREAVTGQDPRASQLPTSSRTRWLTAGGWLVLALGLGAGLLFLDLAPTTGFLVAALTGASLGLALLTAPLVEPLLAKANLVQVPSLGLFRTRSSYVYLGLAAATASLVLAALLSGLALSQAATPDAQTEAGGYAVIAETPRFTDSLGELLPADGPLAEQGRGLLGRSLGLEPMMKVTGDGIHSADTGQLQTVYGIDTSFAQRHQHLVTPLTDSPQDPLGQVAGSQDTAVVSRSVFEALDEPRIAIEGPQGRLTYEVAGIVETRLLEGVYISKAAMPVHFTQFAGQQRILLPDTADPEAYAGDLQEVYKDQGLTAASSQSLVEAQLAGQLQAGTTLQALAGLGLATALLLVLFLGLRAKAERASTDAVFVAQGARPRAIAAGIATETLLPLTVGVLVGAAFLLPVAGQLDTIEGLAFPLLPIDEGQLLLATGLTLVGILVLAAGVSAYVGYSAVKGLDQQALREIG